MKKHDKINIVTLGCSKNLVDSEHILAQLHAAGFSVTYDSNDTDARIVIINTCGFIGDAKEESINTILEFVQAKEHGLIDQLFVVGCLSERYADQLREEIPEVDRYFGVRDINEIVTFLTGTYRRDLKPSRFLTTPKHYAYLKISEGCNWRCAYCAIPLIRGPHVSVPMEVLVDEARQLVQQGVKELIIVGQDTTYYGIDIYGKRMLAGLLRQLARIDGLHWIRLHYTYPSGFPEDVIEVMRSEPKICRYIDIPLQHIADSQLSAMKRGIDRAATEQLLAELRRQIPGIAIRTTLMVGFPGESQDDFETLEEFVRQQKFERLGVFAYSEEEGTPAACLPDNVPEDVKSARVDKIMNLQREISLNANNLRIGKTMRVVIDRIEGDYYIARSEFDSPEVDQEILVKTSAEYSFEAGDFCDVTVTACEEYDLYATPVR